MASIPKRVKHRKVQRGNLRTYATRGNKVAYGDYGLQALTFGFVTERQIEAARVACNRFLKGQGKMYIRVFPDKNFTATPAETRMGKGKGEPDFWAAKIQPGYILYEIGGVPEELAKGAFNRIAHKLPVKVRMVKRRNY